MSSSSDSLFLTLYRKTISGAAELAVDEATWSADSVSIHAKTREVERKDEYEIWITIKDGLQAGEYEVKDSKALTVGFVHNAQAAAVSGTLTIDEINYEAACLSVSFNVQVTGLDGNDPVLQVDCWDFSIGSKG